jgi:hypothetical protein
MDASENQIWDYPCENCGHLGMAHTARSCIEMPCSCVEYRSEARTLAYIERLEAQLHAIGEYVLELRADERVDRDLLAPIWARTLISVAPPTAYDVQRGQQVYRGGVA